MSKLKFTFQLNIYHSKKLFKTVRLPVGSTTIGREDDNDITLPASNVSGSHARIDCTENRCYIIDVGSSNGTRVDRKPIPPHRSIEITEKSRISILAFHMTISVINVERPKPPKPPPSDNDLRTIADDAELSQAPPPPKKPEQQVADDSSEPTTDGATSEKPPSSASPPDDIPPPDLPISEQVDEPEPFEPPPGLDRESQRLINYLPQIYRESPFIVKMLGMFEAILLPIEWTADSFDLFLSPNTSPPDFLPWLAAWYDIVFDFSWPVEKRRMFLREAYQLFALRGTKQGLTRLLTIYTGLEPIIIDMNDVGHPIFEANRTFFAERPVSFIVRLPVTEEEYNPNLVKQLINRHKPAHTNYKLQFKV